MWSIPAGRVFGIPVRIHWTLLLLAATEVFRGWKWYGGTGIALGLAFMAILYVTVLLHELGHCAAGVHEGGDADDILLWPLGGLAMIGGVPRRPRPQIVVNLAGPAVNVVLAVVLGLVLWAGGRGDAIRAALPIVGGGGYHTGWGWYLVAYALGLNVGLLLFNLIPAFPLDGGKAAQWALTPSLGYARATMLTTAIGFALALTLAFLAVLWWQPMLLMLALFVWTFCRWERAALWAEGGGHLEGDIFGYDFSRGYTSLAESEGEPRPGFLARWRERRRAKAEAQTRDIRRRVDDLLVKIGEGGMDTLTEGEKAFLKDASKHYRE